MFVRPTGCSWRLISVCVSLPLFAARGQEALYNAVSLDQTITGQANTVVTQPDQPHLGPVQLSLGAYAGVSYNDNINGSANQPESDVILQPGVNVGFNWPATDRSNLQFATGLGYVHYVTYTANNGLVVTPGSALTYGLSWNDVVITLYDQLSYTRQVTSEAALANVAVLPEFDNVVGARVAWNPGHWTFQTSYGHNIYLSDSAHDYLNRASEYFFGRAGWRFAEATQAGLEASASLTDYQVESQGTANSVSAGGYVEWQALQSFNLTLRGGPTIYQFSAPAQNGGNSSLNSYYASLAVTQQLTDFVSHSLQVNRSVQLGLNQGSSYIEQLSVGYLVSWALTQRISLGATITYDDGRQPLGLFPFQTIEKFQLYGGGLQASWRFTDHLTGSLGYNHWSRNSNLSNRGYSANSESLQLNYTF
jgi:hypothetical protein